MKLKIPFQALAILTTSLCCLACSTAPSTISTSTTATQEMSASEKALIEQAKKLSKIQKIFLGDLGREEGSDLVKEKIRIGLINSGQIQVVEIPEGADATLTGVAGFEKTIRDGDTNYAGIGVVRLVQTSTKDVIWGYEYKRGIMFMGSVSSRVAQQIVDQLLSDFERAKNTTSITQESGVVTEK